MRVRLFNAAALRQAEKREREWWERILGVVWTSDLVHTLAGTQMTQEGEDANAPVDKAAVAARWHKGIRIPLSYLVASHDFVKEMAKRAPLPGKTTGAMPIAMGEYTPKEGDGEIVSLSDSSKARFFEAFAIAGVYPGAQTHDREPEAGTEREAERAAEDTPLDTGPKDEFKGRMKDAIPAYEVDSSRTTRRHRRRRDRKK